MPYSIPEAISEIPALLALVQKIVAGVEALPKPPAPVPAKAYADLIASVLPDLGEIVDQVRADVAD